MYQVIFNRRVVGEYESMEDAVEAKGHLEAIGVPGNSIKIQEVKAEEQDESS